MRKIIPILFIIVCMFALFLAANIFSANALQQTPSATLTAVPSAAPMASPTSIIQATPTTDPIIAELEKEKLQHENDWWWVNKATIISSFLSMLGVIGAIWVGFYQWRKQQEAEQEKRHKDYLFEQAKLDEARFQSVVKGFESDRIEARVGAAILLITFLQKEYEKFYSQVFHLAVSLLRVRNVDPSTPEPMDAMSQALVIVLRQSFPLARGNNLSAFDPFALDATKAQLDNAYLSKTDLRMIRLREASLRKAYFWDAQLQEVYFKHSNMAGAYLRGANLQKADLGDTNLTGANLSKANLKEAKVGGADFTDADFSEADLTDVHIGKVKSLQGTILRGVVGLSAEQLTACAARGAIVDEAKAMEER